MIVSVTPVMVEVELPPGIVATSHVISAEYVKSANRSVFSVFLVSCLVLHPVKIKHDRKIKTSFVFILMIVMLPPNMLIVKLKKNRLDLNPHHATASVS
jgi:hypothetical protein